MLEIDLTYTIAGAVTGFLVGFTGVGGGALMTPILVLLFGIAPTTAVATDLWFAAVTKIVGARSHHAAGNVDWKVASRLWLGSIPLALATVLLISFYSDMVKLDWLTGAIGFVVIVTGLFLLFVPQVLKNATQTHLTEEEGFQKNLAAITVIAGGFLGCCVALTSIGAGAFGTVIMIYLYPRSMTPHRLVATDIVHAIPLAIAAGIGYLFAGLIDYWMLFSLLLGSIPAVILGSKLALNTSGTWIRIGLAIILILVGLKALSSL